MRRLYTYPRSLVLAAAAFLVLAVCATAVAAHPESGKTYSGHTSAAKVNGFSAPVSFKVSSNGKQLLSFKYGNLGCPSTTKPTGNPYLKSVLDVGAIKVSSAGTFSVKNVKTGSTPTYTISSIAGKFKSAKTATGSIKFVNWFSVPGNTHNCGAAAVTFTATTK